MKKTKSLRHAYFTFLQELDVANTTGANIIGLKRTDKSYLLNPHKDTRLTVSDKLFALGTREQLGQLISTITTNRS